MSWQKFGAPLALTSVVDGGRGKTRKGPRGMEENE